MLMVFGGDLEEKKRLAWQKVSTAEENAQRAKEEQASEEAILEGKKNIARELAVKAAKAVAEADAAAAEKKAAEEAVAEKKVMAATAAQGVIDAEQAAKEADAEYAEWEKENPGAALGNAATKVGAAAGSAAVDAVFTSIFGESKAAREAREQREAERAAKAKKGKASEASRKQVDAPTESQASSKHVDAPTESANAAKRTATEDTSEQAAADEAARKAKEEEAARIDAALREKREQAKEILKTRRPKKLSETAKDAALDAAFAAVAGADKTGGVAGWAAQQRENLKAEAEVKAKRDRLALFVPDLELLGLTLDAAVELDDKALRKAWRERSRVLHPDVRAQQDAEATEGVPSVYELNAAFETIRKLL